MKIGDVVCSSLRLGADSPSCSGAAGSRGQVGPVLGRGWRDRDCGLRRQVPQDRTLSLLVRLRQPVDFGMLDRLGWLLKPEHLSHFPDHLGRDVLRLLAVTGQQSVVADVIDNSRNASRYPVNDPDCLRREWPFVDRPGYLQPPPYVVSRLFERHCIHLASQAYSLLELPHLGNVQHPGELRLTTKYDLEELLSTRFEVRKKSDLFQKIKR